MPHRLRHGRTGLLGLLLFGLGAELSAQVDIEGLRIGGDEAGFSGLANLNVSVWEGNVSLAVVSLGARAEWAQAGHTTLLAVRGDMGWESGERFSDQGLVHVRETFRTAELVQPELLAQLDYARPRSLDVRFLVGGGPRFQIADASDARFAMAVAYVFEHERLDLEDGAVHPERTSAHRLSTYTTLAVRSEDRFVLSGTTYLQPRLDAWNDYRILGNGSLKVALGRGLGVNMSFNLRYDSEPPDGLDPLDLTYSSGFSIEF